MRSEHHRSHSDGRPRRVSGGVVGVALALLALPASAASDDPFEPPDLGRYVRWGVLRVRPGFAMPNFGVDDNVFFATGDEPKQSDFRITLGVRLEGLLLLGKRSFFEFDEKFDYTAYQTYSSANFHRQRFESRYTYPFERIGFYADFDNINSQDRLTSELDSRTDRRLRSLGGGVLLRLGWRTTGEIGLVHNDWEFTNPEDPTVGPLLDRVERGPEASFDYRLTGVTRLTLKAEAKDIVFDNPDVGRDSDEWTVLPGVRFGERGRLSGLIGVGVTKIDNKDPSKLDLEEPVGEARLVYKMGYASALDVIASREVGFAVYQNNNYYLHRDAGLTITHFFTRVFGVVGGGGGGRLTFPGSTDPMRVDDVTRYRLGIRWRVARDPLGRRV
ncbi:MAG: outer membrane beta-barrel protein, partial [Acidobacteriota bacterium]|nr:outer membrane beta-barrel protein [Acidobacteriota bacterium]